MQVEALRRNRQPFLTIARETGLSRATVARAGKAKGLRRLSNLDPKIAIVRYEKTLPGEMIHIDIKKLGRGAPHPERGGRLLRGAPTALWSSNASTEDLGNWRDDRASPKETKYRARPHRYNRSACRAHR